MSSHGGGGGGRGGHGSPPEYTNYPDYSGYLDYTALPGAYGEDDPESLPHDQTNPAGVRLLTSVEDPPDSRLYVATAGVISPEAAAAAAAGNLSSPTPKQSDAGTASHFAITSPAKGKANSSGSSSGSNGIDSGGSGSSTPGAGAFHIQELADNTAVAIDVRAHAHAHAHARARAPDKDPDLHPSPLCPSEKHQQPVVSTRDGPTKVRFQEEAKPPSPPRVSPLTTTIGPKRAGVTHVPRSQTVKLQRRHNREPITASPTPAAEEHDAILASLPTLPPRQLSSRQSRKQLEPTTKLASPAAATVVTRSLPLISPSDDHGYHGGYSQGRAAYQPSLSSQNSMRSSIRNPPRMPPPTDSNSYAAFHHSRDRPGSPTRPWSPSTMSDFPRPPPSTTYEPADLHGTPRPGTSASSGYGGGGSRRRLPTAPFYNGRPEERDSATSFADDATVSIPLDYRGGGHMYGAETDLSDHRGYEHPYDDEDHHYRDPYDYDEGFSPSNEGLGSPYMHEKVGGHYGPAPEGKQVRRGIRALQMSKKEVQLINGELVLECKIPTILYSFLPRRDEVEFTHMRYTAVTCDPDDFVPRGYKLRQNIGRTTRETELFICVTMYNENELDFTRTMHAVMKNISHFCGRNKSRTWGENGWRKIVVCIVSDGREKIHPRTLDALAAMGVYQHGIAKNFVNSKAVQAHVYEYTTQVSLDSDLKFKGAEKGIVPCQIIFCLKEKNQRKLNSHRWCFNAFGKALNPNVCILLDVGTRPGSNSLYHLWKAFDTDSNVAGACGEIKAMKGKLGSNLLNPLVASQNFEYKLSNILDKPLESVFGYITVLPGALSAYRYHALQNDETGHGPLSQYFKGETLHGQHADVFTANMYLAEDRILCWELVAKRGERWVLKYVKACTGETDVPDTVPEFISQRRRWLNGAFFAAVYSLVHFRQVWATDHTVARKVLLHIEFVYQALQLLFTYFALANFYLTFFFIAGGLADPRNDPFGHKVGMYIFTILRYACVLLICTQFILSLGNRPQGAKRLYFASMLFYGVIMVYTTFACIYIVITQFTGAANDGKKPDMTLGNNVFTNLIVSTTSTLGLYFIMSFLYLDPWHMFSSLIQYFLLLPSYICTLQVYAFCNTHDVTWGTKGDNVSRTDLGGAIGKGNSNSVELEMPSEQLDIDSGYDEALRNLRDRIEVGETPVSEAQMQEDYYKSVRTYMVISWMIANAILAMAVSEAYGQSSIGDNFYLRFILWSVAGLALFRAIGSTTYAIINVVNMVVEGRVRMSLKVPRWMGGLSGRVSDTMSSISSRMR